MNVILLGAPGAGKGTQAVRIAAAKKIPHISTGDIFRKNIKEGTPIGKKAKEYIDKGALVPDEVTVEIVRGRLAEPDCADGYLLDGFPRSAAQAQALDAFTSIDRVVNIDIDLKLLSDRLTGRRVCAKCGESYHVKTATGTECTKTGCGGALIQRPDDVVDTVNNRLHVYTVQTAPLIEYYARKGLLVTVDGNQSIDSVARSIDAVLR